MDISGQKISIIGAVRSGIAAAKLAKKMGAVPFVSDFSPAEKMIENKSKLETEGIQFEFGHHSGRVLDCDLIVTSPGVPSDSEILKSAQEKNIRIISELEFGFRVCKGKIIAITGTNGKTTTTMLCSHILNSGGFKTYTAGNIGLAFSEIALDVKENEYVSLETSSFQLDFIEKFKPDFGIILNITPDHLDRYDNVFQNYIDSKMNIMSNQDSSDYFIYNADDENTPRSFNNNSVNIYSFSTSKKINGGSYCDGGKIIFNSDGKNEIVCDTNVISLKGEHNLSNALPVVTVSKLMGISNGVIKEALSSFPGVEHRLEFVREYRGVIYINDSKATNVDSVWYALRSFDKPVYLILGGKDKGNDYNRIKSLVIKNVKKIYAIGSSADKVYDFFNIDVDVEKVGSLDEAVSKAHKEALENEIVMLSPACASFDMFDNYEHRGKVFKKAVNNLT
jgi:UDP-N-acetylmuramoylalanine--D-glutamate ligase